MKKLDARQHAAVRTMARKTKLRKVLLRALYACRSAFREELPSIAEHCDGLRSGRSRDQYPNNLDVDFRHLHLPRKPKYEIIECCVAIIVAIKALEDGIEHANHLYSLIRIAVLPLRGHAAIRANSLAAKLLAESFGLSKEEERVLSSPSSDPVTDPYMIGWSGVLSLYFLDAIGDRLESLRGSEAQVLLLGGGIGELARLLVEEYDLRTNPLVTDIVEKYLLIARLRGFDTGFLDVTGPDPKAVATADFVFFSNPGPKVDKRDVRDRIASAMKPGSHFVWSSNDDFYRTVHVDKIN